MFQEGKLKKQLSIVVGKLVAFRDWLFGTGFFHSEPRNILYSTFVRRLVFIHRDQLSQLRICSILFRECVECTILFILFISYLLRTLRTITDLYGLISGVLRRGLYRSLPHSVFDPFALPRACEWLYTTDIVYPLYSQHRSIYFYIIYIKKETILVKRLPPFLFSSLGLLPFSTCSSRRDQF